MGTLLSIQALKKSFGTRVLFEGIQFSLNEDERVGLIGPNGAGKSTLLAIMAGQVSADEGAIVPQKGLKVAFLEQTPPLDLQKSMLDTILEGAGDDDDQIHRALEAFSRVGLDELGREPETSLSELSGGWRKRVALARELVRQPDILFLDEPTNHLDVDAILWLESFLKRAPMAVVTVTHDRAFLQNTSNRILELDRRNPGGLLSVEGSYATYLERKTQLLETQKSQESSMRNRLRRETEWLKRGAKARTTKQQARIHRATELQEDVDEISARNQSQDLRLNFGDGTKRSKRYIESKAISKTLGEQLLFEGLDIFLGPGSRLGLVGANGSGKTTLIRVLLGELPPDEGKLILADGLAIAYFQQHRESLDPTITLQKSVCPSGDHVDFQGRNIHVRSYLDRFLFSPDQADQPVSKLSGGEQSRLLIAKLMLKPADVLVLDEPTNDLDIATLDVLEECLVQFKGAVILVSHDRYFLDRVSNILLAFSPNSSDVVSFSDLAQWASWNSNQLKEKKKEQQDSSKKGSSKKKKKLSYKESRELESMEERIHKAEEELKKLNEEAQKPENLSNSDKLSELYASLSTAQAQVDQLFERWQELESLQKEYES